MHFQRPSLPTLTSQCYLQNFPEDCQLSLQPLYNILRSQCQALDPISSNISLVAMFRLLKQWQFELPFSLIAKLFVSSNRAAHQSLRQEINEASFHQLMHNPDLQQMYRRKPVAVIPGIVNQPKSTATPQTLYSLFTRLGELVQRKQLYGRINEENLGIKEKFAFMVQLMNVGAPPEKPERQQATELFPTLPQQTILFEDQEQASVIEHKEEKTKLEIELPKKFLKVVQSDDKMKINSRVRRLHSNMIKQMAELRSSDSNVKKVSNLIHKTQGNFFIKLPEI